MLTTTISHELVSKFSCDDSIDKCMIEKCEACSGTKLCHENFNKESTSDNNATKSLSKGTNK